MTQATTYNCYIKQCAIPTCDNWFIGTPRARYCQSHKKSRYEVMMVGWRAAQLNGGTGKHSRFSEEEILEIRDMYFRMPVKEIAKHFNCHVSLIYRYINRNPNRFRVV